MYIISYKYFAFIAPLRDPFLDFPAKLSAVAKKEEIRSVKNRIFLSLRLWRELKNEFIDVDTFFLLILFEI